MGESFKIICKDCLEFEDSKHIDSMIWKELSEKLPTPYFHISTGVGFIDFKRKKFLLETIKSNELKNEIIQKFKDGFDISQNYDFSTYYCNKCKAIESHLHFILYIGIK